MQSLKQTFGNELKITIIVGTGHKVTARVGRRGYGWVIKLFHQFRWAIENFRKWMGY